MIYLLDENPAENAKMLDDKTLSRQIRGIAQYLCNAHYLKAVFTPLQPNQRLDDLTKDIPLPLKNNNEGLSASHDSYSKWAYECSVNYNKLVEMGLACFSEYRCRGLINKDEYNSIYEYENILEWTRDNVPDLPIYYGTVNEALANPKEHLENYLNENTNEKTTPFPVCVMDKYKVFKIGRDDEGWIEYDINIIESYRNYYRTKIYEKEDKTKLINCDLCKDTMPHMIAIPYELPKWTRRERPKFLNEV